jgi:hypothetical protein
MCRLGDTVSVSEAWPHRPLFTFSLAEYEHEFFELGAAGLCWTRETAAMVAVWSTVRANRTLVPCVHLTILRKILHVTDVGLKII